jgi:hypothetical protein
MSLAVVDRLGLERGHLNYEATTTEELSDGDIKRQLNHV